MVVRELCKDVRENLPGDSAAGSARLRSITPFSGGDEALEDGAVKCVKGPPVLGVDCPEAREVAGQCSGLDSGCLDSDKELYGGSVRREHTAVGTGEASLSGKGAEHADMTVVFCAS
jgi:hypothetical protein